MVQDGDVALLDRHWGMHFGGSMGAMGFGTAALAGGIYNFGLMAEGQPTFILALTLCSMGVATVVSSATGLYQSTSAWQSLRKAFDGAGDAQRRLLRDSESARLKGIAINRSIGLAADGTFLGLGIALMFLPGTAAFALPLVLDGAFLLSIDIYRVVVDDQTSRQWKDRGQDADRGYFTNRRRLPPPRMVLLPWVTPAAVAAGARHGQLVSATEQDLSVGGVFVVAGVF